jgi:hypothetical protein
VRRNQKKVQVASSPGEADPRSLLA